MAKWVQMAPDNLRTERFKKLLLQLLKCLGIGKLEQAASSFEPTQLHTQVRPCSNLANVPPESEEVANRGQSPGDLVGFCRLSG
ncbi:uncharacterized protein PGTG_19172 [Puccinia graminis f. sp. tritici CRL 75-36-700-3]|uniref:Uncharacterized protein n=1 Tax=Puccinia graminis f. sp. tritici (strain CRL 75-36-700-3 / race SCCL) TaxID=418459 RepID=E3L9K1_PUCGT|nr:uncharacterized protein PGTG_19172 [Puccinia graminis f. sp. tritici CRL 75-36-700-3]EFP93226.2 hypothetical protein PGTG_19172 [Puccinia graminis f. sp. tritici CRL 75-36-700-3]